MVRESVVQVGYDPVWRFKPDFKRRFIVSTSQSGGVCVIDMDDGHMLWRLRREDVRMCASNSRYGYHGRCWRVISVFTTSLQVCFKESLIKKLSRKIETYSSSKTVVFLSSNFERSC